MTVADVPTPASVPPVGAAEFSRSLPAVEPAHIEYQRRLEDRRAELRTAQQADDRLALGRGLAFFGGLGWLVLCWNVAGLPEWLVLLPATVFVGLVVVHGRVLNTVLQSQRAVAYYERACDRIDDRWMGTGPDGRRYVDSTHPYTGDLDIFGQGSLFQLLSTCRTRLGEDTLAGWLSSAAEPQIVRQRQDAIRELDHQLDLRERLALLDAEVHDELNQNLLLDWARRQGGSVGLVRRVMAVLLAIAALAAVVYWATGNGITPFATVLVAEMLLVVSLRDRLAHMAESLSSVGSGLAILAQVLHVFEDHDFADPSLRQLRENLDVGGVSPSQRIWQLRNRIQSIHNSVQNQFFMPFAYVLCLHVHFVHAIDRWHAEVGPHIADWLTAVGEFEAMCSLAGYAYEHADDVFPELEENGACFHAVHLGHPLLPANDCVRNDVSLDDSQQLMMISGSNMSGKSTLLRAVGTNAVLGLAGAPVRATSMRLSCVSVGTAMRVQDSLQKGASLFYTSVARLKKIVDLSQSDRTLLFLFDEILQGTNSHDRRVGAEGIVRQLVERRAIGLVTTHDLALTEIVQPLGERAVNVHFEDRLVDGTMEFDYQLRPGVVQRSNALALMKMVGLKVDEDAGAAAVNES